MVICYGHVTTDTDELAKLQTLLLGHFGTLDKSINPERVGAFQQRLRAVGKQDLLITHWYTAGHAFANPSGGRYDQDDAELAWPARTHFWRKVYASPIHLSFDMPGHAGHAGHASKKPGRIYQRLKTCL